MGLYKQLRGARFVLRWKIMGVVNDDLEQDGFRVVPLDSVVETVFMSVMQRGKNGTTIIDINKGAPGLSGPGQSAYNTSLSSIYTTQGNRPQIVGLTGSETQNALIWAALPNVLTLNQGNILALDIDQVAPDVMDLVVELTARQT